MPQIPREETPDSSLALLSEGYTFVSRRCERFRSDVFETRLMLRRAICMMGEEAAREFYVPGRFTRKGGLPMPGLMLLQDLGSAVRAVELLTGSMTYRVPPQDLDMKLSRMPAIPRSRFVISAVQATG